METLEGIAENDGIVVLKHAEQDPVLGPVLQSVLDTMFSYFPNDWRRDITVGESIIFITSPRRRTAYHMDLESSFLLQVAGSKIVHVFNHKDRSLVPDSEIAGLCCGDQNAAIFKPDRQHEAVRYQLTPGVGVHFPSLAPHAVQNGDEVSISVNINFDHRSLHHRLRPIHRCNRKLQRLGLRPSVPGSFPLLDSAKAGLMTGLDLLRDAVRPPASNYPQWEPPKVS